jgi:cytochrome c oxidase cbb3-type subunit III
MAYSTRKHCAAIGTACGLLIAAVTSASSESAPQTSEAGAKLEPPARSMLDVPVTTLIPGDIAIDPRVKNSVADDADAANRGMGYFANFNCSGCHADNGGGGMGPALSNRAFTYGRDPENIYLSIAQGRPDGMPAWGTLLPETVIWDMVAYIRSISAAPGETWGSTTSRETYEIEQVPSDAPTPDPWKYTQPFSFGQKPGGG